MTFFVLTGEVTVLVNGRTVASRPAGTHVGEMALVDPLAKRSATVIAAESTVAIMLAEHHFSKIASRHPELWRRKFTLGCQNGYSSAEPELDIVAHSSLQSFA